MRLIENMRERMSQAGEVSGTAWLFWYEHRGISVTAIAMLVIGFAAALPTKAAHAIDGVPIVSDILTWLYNGLLQPAEDMMHKLVDGSSLLGEFANLFGAGSQGYDLVSNICNSLITPLGYVTLAIVFLVQTARIAGKFDANGTMPAVKEVIFLFIYFVIFKVLIDNSFDFCVAVFDGINSITNSIYNSGYGGSLEGVTFFGNALTNGADGNPFVILLRVLAAYIVAAAASIVGFFVVFARSLQIYVYSAFAPVPLALLALDETRSFGTGYIRNYIAVCLSGAIMIVVIMLFPAVARAAIGLENGTIALFGACIMFIMGLVKSGSWARDILGG